jgi:hypothetical protein
MALKSTALAVTALVLSSTANAALIERLGGSAYYDDVADITWLADATYAKTSGYDIDGLMNWYDSTDWASNLNIGGVTGWRLPSISEMENLHFNVLNNPAGGFTNAGPFTNLPADDGHWSSTDSTPGNAWDFFFLDGTSNDHSGDINTKEFGELYAWAVYDGDVSAVPVPAAAWLFGSGLIGLVGIARRKKSNLNKR